MLHTLGFLNKLTNRLFSTRAAGLYILLFAISIGTATFIENDFGTSSAQKVVYTSWWFSTLLVLFCVTIIVSIFRFRMIQQRKWMLLTFHVSIIVILIGAAVTRYFGYEGVMHIRENDVNNSFLSAETYLQFQVSRAGQTYAFDEEVMFATLGNNHFNGAYQIGDHLVTVDLLEFIPNPAQVLKASSRGKPIVKIVIGGSGGREEYFVRKGESTRIANLLFNFSETEPSDGINIAYRNDSLLIQSNRTLIQRVMATQTTDTLVARRGYYPLKLRSLYTDGNSSFVVGDFMPKGELHLESESPKVRNESIVGLKLLVTVNGIADTVHVYGSKGQRGAPAVLTVNGLDLAVAYGGKKIVLPFSIRLNDFIMERYPGTNSAASYASEVKLLDSRKNLEENHRIYMNHILDYEGYRFFQSSYDNDEMGTYLSVNHDFWGTWISYLGYALLTTGLVLSLFSKKSRFYQISQSLEKLRGKPSGAAALMIIISVVGSTTDISAQRVISVSSFNNTIDVSHADDFSRLIVQDQNGRMKPVHTLSRELMRKLTKKESLNGLNADQIVLGMFANTQDWIGVDMIDIGKHPEIHTLLGVSRSKVSYEDFFDSGGQYRLTDEVRRAYGLQPIDRGVYEKELMKIDERVNIANMVFSGSIFKIIPVPQDPNRTWVANESGHHDHDHGNAPEMTVAARFFDAYRHALQEAMSTNDYRLPGKMISELYTFQKSNGGDVIPSPGRINAEILLNKLNIFNRLAILYAVLGVVLLFSLFYSVFSPATNLTTLSTILLGIVIAGFVVHTIGLGIRWYVSERAPWSNGYESMIYIAWTTVLGGLIFTRNSLGGLAATMILSATVLLVAILSYMDPEITPLVPVLRSYWLTIHVSLEAGSYGFLMLGAIIGLINLILMIFLNGSNKDKVYRKIKEMSYLSEMTLIGGLVMISIGTYLGGVWANESWGRYWGWDAKETWALVTILIYAFILHMRLIPSLQGLFAYNFATIFGLASVIMTYYGVNYYLSGLHSYAAGDPVPVPQWVYIVITAVLAISALAFRKKRMYKIST